MLPKTPALSNGENCGRRNDPYLRTALGHIALVQDFENSLVDHGKPTFVAGFHCRQSYKYE